MLHVFILRNILIPVMIYSFLRFVSPSYALTLIMLRLMISHLAQVGLTGVIASNYTWLAKANFGGVTV